MIWLNTVAELTDPRPARAALPITEYVFNDTTRNVSHLVVELTFGDFGDSATTCGVIATSADIFANYDLCADCTGKDAR